MSYTLNEYLGLQAHEVRDTRVEVCSGADCYAKMLAHYRSRGLRQMPIDSLIPARAAELPMPKALFEQIDAAVRQQGQRVVVTGLGDYFRLLDGMNVRDSWLALRSRLDSQRLNAVFLFASAQTYPKEVFSNPKYINSLYLALLHDGPDNPDDAPDPQLRIAPRKWLEAGSYCDGYAEALSRIASVGAAEPIFIAAGDQAHPQAGLSAHVVFVESARQFAAEVYGFTPDLPETVFDGLLSEAVSQSKKPEELLLARFGADKIDPRDAVRRLAELKNDPLWLAYRWLLLQKTSSDTLLFEALRGADSFTSFMERYVVTCPMQSIERGAPNVQTWADERRSAIQRLSVAEGLITSFVAQAADDTRALPYLNCETKAECCELIRRCAPALAYGGRLPAAITQAFPRLGEYYETTYDTGASQVDAYFSEYRLNRLRNMVPEPFLRLVSTFEIPAAIKSRDLLLAADAQREDTALLVADGLGAEYLPYLLAVASRLGYGVESAFAVRAKLPTTTAFNRIDWPESRLIKASKAVDNIVHYGAEKNESSGYEEDFCLLLEKMEEVILKERIGVALQQYGRVVLTADHGASRLAALAHQLGVAPQLDEVKNPLDWRYAEEPTGSAQAPAGVEPVYREELEKTYWVSKGYARFPKKGGKQHLLHGGGSPEEVLVPYIVFTRDGAVREVRPVNVVPEQIIEDDFDI